MATTAAIATIPTAAIRMAIVVAIDRRETVALHRALNFDRAIGSRLANDARSE
jgi:hypothetical protein